MAISIPYMFKMGISIPYSFVTDVDLGNGFRYPVATWVLLFLSRQMIQDIKITRELRHFLSCFGRRSRVVVHHSWSLVTTPNFLDLLCPWKAPRHVYKPASPIWKLGTTVKTQTQPMVEPKKLETKSGWLSYWTKKVGPDHGFNQKKLGTDSLAGSAHLKDRF